MADIASLIIKVNSTDVETTRKRLRELGITAQDTSAKVSGSADKISKSSAGMATALRSAAAAFVGLQAATALANVADKTVMLDSRLKQVTKSASEYQNVQKQLIGIAEQNRTQLAATTQLYIKLQPALKAVNASTQETINVVSSFSSALLVGGANAQEAAAATLQFAQAMGSGVLRGDEFNSIAEASPRILQAIADGAGVARGELRKMAEDGMLTAATVSGALLKEMIQLKAESVAFGATISGAGTVVGSTFLKTADEVNKATGATSVFANAILATQPIITGIGQAIISLTRFVSDNATAFIVLTGAVAGFAAKAAISSAIAAIGTAIAAISTGALGAAFALGGLGLAFDVLKIRMLGFVASIPGVGLLLAGIGAASAYAVSKMGESSVQLKQTSETGAKAISDLRAQIDGLNKGGDAQKAFEKKTAVDNLVAAYKAQGATEKELLQIRALANQLQDANLKSSERMLAQGQRELEQAQAKKKAEQDAAAAIKDRQAKQAAADKARRDGLQSIADKVATFKMDEFERMEFDFAKLSPSADQLASFTAYVDQLKRLTSSQAELEAFGALIDRIFTEQEDAAKAASKTIDDFLAKDFGSNLAAGFDKAGQSLGAFVNGFDKLIQAQEMYNEARLKAAGDSDKIAKIDARQKANELGIYAELAGAAKGLTKEKSAGYKALAKIEQGLRIAQIAHSAWEKKDEAIKLAVKLKGYATDLGTFLASIPVKIAGFLGVGVAAGSAATAAAAIQPGPAAFVGFAAMAALIASIGLGGGGKKGPGFTDNTGTGTVLGDSGAQSKSIANSIEALESAASLENRISSAMLASLKNIEANISGLASLIVRGDVGGGLAAQVNTGFKMDGIGKTLNFLANPLPFLDFLGLNKALGKVLGGLFGSKSKITGQGLTAVSQTLGDIMQNGFDLLEFVAIQTKKKSFGITTSTKNSVRTSLADPELTRQFGLIFSDFSNAIVAAADPLGFSTEAIANRLESFVVNIGKINLKGLKGDEIQEKLEAVFGAQADKMAEYAFPMLTEFQKVGEGLFETVVRVASGIEQADTLLTRLGLTAVNYTTLLNTQGDIATEIIRQSVLLTDRTKGIAGGFAEIVANFQGTGEEITDLVLQLRDMQDAIRATGKAGEYLTTFMIAGAGGADRLTDGLDAFFDFLSPAEQAAELTRRVSNEFARIGQIVPQSVQGFRELIAGIDISTEAGQKLYGQVIALAPAFSDLQDALASVKDEAQDAKDAITKAFKDLSDAIKTAESDLQAAFNRESTALKELIRNHDDAAKRLREFSRSLVGALDTPEQSLSRLRAEFDAIARAARLGDSAAVSRLPEVGGALKDAVLANAVTALDAAREIARIRAESDAAATVQERQKTIAEQQLDALTLSVDSLIQVGDNILTVRDAVDNLKALQTFENKAIADATALGLNSLAQQNGLTLSAIERGTAASNAINAGIASLVGIQAKQEADRQATIAAQKAEAERQAKINALTAQAKPLTDVVAQQVAVRSQSAADLAKLQADAYALAKSKGVAINAESGAVNFTNSAQFGVGESGLYEQKFGQISFRNSPAGANAFKSEFYAAGGIYDQILAEAAQLASAKSARETSEAQLNALRQQITALGGIPAFATGGMHSGGLRLVGENGPELEYTGPSRIFNAGQTSSMLDNSEQVAEMRMLRDEMKGYLWSISKSTLRTADRLDRWDDGDRMNVRIDNESDDPALVRTVA